VHELCLTRLFSHKKKGGDMPLPPAASTVTVTEDYFAADGSAKSGSVTFIPSVYFIVSGSIVIPDPIVAIVTNGVMSVVLAATDDADLSPTGWTYRVIERIGSQERSWSISLPSSPSTVKLSALAPVTPVTPTITQVRSVNGVLPDSTGNITVPTGGVPTSRQVIAGAGLSGGGDLTTDRTFIVLYGTSAGTACVGNDARLSDARTPLAHTHAIADTIGLQAALNATATKSIVRQAYFTSGNIQLNTGTNVWAPLTGSPTLPIPAAVGDYVELDMTVIRQENAGIYLDTGVVVSGAIVRYLATGTSTPAGEGDPALYHTALPARSGSRGFVVTSGDLSGGAVTFSFAIRNTTGASSLLLASADNPLILKATNSGVVDFGP
jgi:hypothetical protein